MADTEGPSDRLRDVQGNLVGFNKDHMRLVFVSFADAVSGRECLAALLPQLSNGYEVLHFNDLYKEIRVVRRGDRGIIQAAWTNLWLSRSALELLEAPGMDTFPDDFTQGMAARAGQIGDVGSSAPDQWMGPFAPGTAEPHGVLVFAADDPGDLQARVDAVLAIAQQHGVSVLGEQNGDVRAGDAKGREHFGFKDGISQPSIQGFTTSSKGGASVAAGEFVVGYPNTDGDISGQSPAAPPPQPSGYDPAPPVPLAQPLPDWTRNGSFVVYRRLRQNVAAFRAAMAGSAADVTLSPEQLAAKLVGRWPSGAPLERVSGEPRDLDPSTQDPSSVYPRVLDDDKINTFDYSADPDGTSVPRAGHIRKANPRADVLPEGDHSSRHRMLRRGIPYGPEFQEGEAPYGQVVPDEQDRGLLFVCYQASISRTFEFVQARWANAVDFQQAGDGKDPIISQDADQRPFTLPPGHAFSFAPWVFTTGGGYFFAPSLSGLEKLATVAATDTAGA